MLAVVVLLSLLTGVTLGLLGGGGSILTVPILRYLLGMDAHDAIAVSLLVVGTTSAVALAIYAKKGPVEWRKGLTFGLASMGGAYLGGQVAHFVPSALLLGAFAVVMFVSAFMMMRGRKSESVGSTDKTVADQNAASETGLIKSPTTKLALQKMLLQGFGVGALTGMVGAGGGFLVVPALVILGGMSMAVAVPTSLLVIAMNSVAGFLGTLGHTVINWRLAGMVTTSAVIGSFVGIALTKHISPVALRQGFGWFVIGMAFFILGQEVPRAFGIQPQLSYVVLFSVLALLSLVTSVQARAMFVRKKIRLTLSGELGATPKI